MEAIMKLFLALLLFCIPITAQTREELLKKYGNPVLEIYQVRPNISVSVTYNKEEKVCRMLIKPTTPESQLPAPTLESLKAIADELVPHQARGRNIINGFMSGVEIYGTSYDYENLKIYSAFNEKNEIWVNIVWKAKACNISW
jgi:hypothetical protein